MTERKPQTIAEAWTRLGDALYELVELTIGPVYDRLNAELEELVLWHRRPRVVLWGGKPSRDLAFGSPEDRRRALRLAVFARYRVSVVRIELAFRDALTPAILDAARKVAEFERSMRAVQRTSGMSAAELAARLSPRRTGRLR